MIAYLAEIQQLSGAVTNIWVREWANQYQIEGTSHPSHSHGLKLQDASFGYGLSNPEHATLASWVQQAGSSTVIATIAPGVNVPYYLAVLATIGAVGGVSVFCSDICVFYGSLNASRNIHTNLITSISRARFNLFDDSRLGQLINTFSKDIEAVDHDIAPVVNSIILYAIGILVTVMAISFVTSLFPVTELFIALIFWLVGWLYLETSRQLKRLESNQRSPLFQHFSETLSGLTTIRAHGNDQLCLRVNQEHIDKWARLSISRSGCNRWFTFWCIILGNSVALSAGIFSVLNRGRIQAGDVGISMSYALRFGDEIQQLVRHYASGEINMIAVARIMEYLDVEKEAEAIVEGNRPEHWPAEGAVEFIDYTTHYHPKKPVLNHVSFNIEPGQKVGIVGRTGTGKSSLLLAISRALEAETGKIEIDGKNIASIGLHDLRQAITIVPQDQTLFEDTLRRNVDPFDTFTDEEIFTALRRVHLIGPEEATTLSMNTFLNLSSRNNFSQGQKQLLCLVRAMLQNPKVLIMDEATASIDDATEAFIQEVIRGLKCTTITIAHRLQTIVGYYDRVLVLDKGRVVEYGLPSELLEKGGVFSAMCRAGGIRGYDRLV